MNRHGTVIAVLVCIGGLGCSSSPKSSVADASPDAVAPAGDGGNTVAVSGKARELIAALPPEVATLTAGNTDFAVRLLMYLRALEPQENLFFSPHSISVALAMTYAGARTTTATEMATALDFRMSEPALHRAFNGLDQELARRQQPVAGDLSGGEPAKLNIVNALWGQRGYSFLPPFLDTLAVNYAAGVRLLDFAMDPEAARMTINQWVAAETAGRIADLLRAGDISPTTVLVLTNAIYFKASWQQPFLPDGTTERPFQLVGGQSIMVPTMVKQEQFQYAESADLQAVALPYKGGKLAMVVVAPRAGKLAGVENILTADLLAAILSDLRPTEVLLHLPKFKVEARFSLKEALMAMGMPLAFSNNDADFSGIDGTRRLRIADVVHQGFVTVDEKGTEAAAATAVIVGPPSGPPTPIEVKIDRPFLFFVRDEPTGAILFVGRVLDPS